MVINITLGEGKVIKDKRLKKYPKRIQVTDLNGNQLLDFAPDRYHPETMLLRDGQLWVMAKPDPDMRRIF